MIRATFAVNEADSIMVRARATTSVRGFRVGSRRVRLRVRLQYLARDYLSATCFDRLTTCVGVGRFRAILRIFLFRGVGHFRRFAKYRTGLANVSSTVFPFAASQEDRLGTSACIEARVRLLYRFNCRTWFVRFLRCRRGTFPRLLYRRDRLSVAFILVSIASGR